MTAKPELKTKKISSETTQDNPSTAETNQAIFQAVGIITGDVNFENEKKAILTVAEQTYPLFYKPRLQVAMEALKLEIQNTGLTRQRLIVYPKLTHFPKPDQPHQIAFQLIGFEKDAAPSAISTQLEDFEFKLCGLWQFIPVCRVPVISVFRNFDEQTYQKFKELEAKKKVRFMKPAHVPVMWKDSPFKPFRFNPRIDKEQQGRPLFIQIKAKFIPEKTGFEFVALLAPPSGETSQVSQSIKRR
ncbi:hypothetical protein [Oscillatoria acuminata]|uniref:Uncharacterized protein n=1 Tax=Oscillatoria acuminata PCC 6304 TaxID=56110 RepID=K9TQR7_9CYAN|nr:hypothetical protein [Oscillatoria acuminata]AFY84329.1 hypothetical protein Oscil6304_4822 [Oscillatoria acuminata PCC 6304]